MTELYIKETKFISTNKHCPKCDDDILFYCDDGKQKKRYICTNKNDDTCYHFEDGFAFFGIWSYKIIDEFQKKIKSYKIKLINEI